MKLLTEAIRNKMINNYSRSSEEGEPIDHKPVVKLFTPDGNATWLLTELEAETNLAFGLCDLGMGYPELGYVSIDELMTVRGQLGLPVERDRSFEADKTLSEYSKEARLKERIYA